MGRGRGRGRGTAVSDAASMVSTAPSVGPQGAQPNPSQPVWNNPNASHNINTSVPLPDTTQRFDDLNINEPTSSQQPTGKSTSSSDSVPLETFRFNTTQKTPEHCKFKLILFGFHI